MALRGTWDGPEGRLSPARCILVVMAFSMLSACAAKEPLWQPSDEETAAELQAIIESEQVEDRRGRFREIYCDVLEAHGHELPDYRPCDEALRRTGFEEGATGKPVMLGERRSDFLALLVPGLGWNCFAEWLDLSGSVREHIERYGWDLREVPVDGLSSTENNARMIRDFVAGLPEEDSDRPLVLLGYSKGTPDILTALVDYPELAERVEAVVSVAGAVRGSPLSENASQAQANMLTLVPGSACEKEDGDNDAVRSLHPDIRQEWLAQNPLPDGVRFYSIITFPKPERVSWVLRNSYLLLGETDVRNDSQLVIFDQLIPGSTVMAVVNADHWAVAVPIQRSHRFVGATFVSRNDYPREAFLEAILRFLEEDLAEKE